MATEPTPLETSQPASGGAPVANPSATPAHDGPVAPQESDAAVHQADITHPDAGIEGVSKPVADTPVQESTRLADHGAVQRSFTTTQGIAGAVMVLGALLVAYAAKRHVLARRAAQSVPAAQTDEATGDTQDELASDMQTLADRLAAEMDERAGRLEQLIAAADERLEKLAAAGRAAPVAAAVVEAKPATRKSHAAGLEAAHRDVYELADAGLTPLEIATRLERPTGQIELILNLRRSGAAW